jgi:hypothetical protein
MAGPSSRCGSHSCSFVRVVVEEILRAGWVERSVIMYVQGESWSRYVVMPLVKGMILKSGRVLRESLPSPPTMAGGAKFKLMGMRGICDRVLGRG